MEFSEKLVWIVSHFKSMNVLENFVPFSFLETFVQITTFSISWHSVNCLVLKKHTKRYIEKIMGTLGTMYALTSFWVKHCSNTPFLCSSYCLFSVTVSHSWEWDTVRLRFVCSVTLKLRFLKKTSRFADLLCIPNRPNQ